MTSIAAYDDHLTLQSLSVEMIATDRYDNPPGQQVPHHARAFVTSGPALIKALTEKEKPFICLNASNTIPAVRSIPR